MHDQGVIAAIASPGGASARIVLRLSGEGSWAIVRHLTGSELPMGGLVRLSVDGMDVPATLLRFAQGYTGEESAELHVPGNVLLARMVLQRLYALGARPAEPGEFTARAFFSGRLDLAEAEGVAATIHATNERELAAGRKLQSGELARRLAPITDELTQILALVEAGIDFSEDDIRFLSADELVRKAEALILRLRGLLEESVRFERLAHEPTIVLCGRPNSGKSTLLNALTGRRRAVVSAMAGTTRDVLEAEVELERGVVRVIDTAGVEMEHKDALPDVERQMRERAVAAIGAADVVVLVEEIGGTHLSESWPRSPDLFVASKSDLYPPSCVRQPYLPVSAITAAGMDELRIRLDELAFGSRGGELLALNARHVRQIETACAELGILAREAESRTEELSAEHLRYALDALGEITGMVSPDELLGRVFATFCIGK
jgi:tRNA modification GTPase